MMEGGLVSVNFMMVSLQIAKVQCNYIMSADSGGQP